MDNSDVCAKCSSNVRTLFRAPNKNDYCIDCIRDIYPPHMTVIKYPTGNMYNTETGMYETITDPEDLEICGWGVKMIQELPNGAFFVYMEFRGDTNCGRCTDYEWGLDGQYCMSSACMNHREKKPIDQRCYPKWPSFYLNWKYPERIK
jgi:hypothetical protein